MVCWLFCSSKCTYCSHCSVWKYTRVLKCVTLQFCLCLVYYDACKQQMWLFFIISYKRTEIICYFYGFYSFNCIMYFIRTNVPFWCESATDSVLSIFVWFYHVHWKYLILYWLFLCCLLRLKVPLILCHDCFLIVCYYFIMHSGVLLAWDYFPSFARLPSGWATQSTLAQLTARYTPVFAVRWAWQSFI